MDILIILIILFHKHEIVFSYVLFSISLTNIHNSEYIDFLPPLLNLFKNILFFLTYYVIIFLISFKDNL